MIALLRRLWRAQRFDEAPQQPIVVTPSDTPSAPPAAQVAAAKAARPLQVTVACDASQALAALSRATDLAAAIAAAPCEPTRAPDRPDHVARARANRAAHYRALGEDPEADWGPFVNPYDDGPGEAA